MLGLGHIDQILTGVPAALDTYPRRAGWVAVSLVSFFFWGGGALHWGLKIGAGQAFTFALLVLLLNDLWLCVLTWHVLMPVNVDVWVKHVKHVCIMPCVTLFRSAVLLRMDETFFSAHSLSLQCTECGV